MNKHHELTDPADEQQITLRGPAELADALPYMMGFHPNDSIVLVALHGNRGRFGGRLRLGIPSSPREWPPVAEQLAECLIEGSERRGQRPDGIVIFLCQDAATDETGHQVMERLRPLAQRLRTACGAFEVPVYEALCISDGRFWSYCCPDARCCPAEGSPLALPGTSVMAAAAAYAGIQVRGSLRQMEGRLAPLTTSSAAEQENALDVAGAALVPRILDDEGRKQVASATLGLADRLMKRIAATPRTGGWAETDAADDRLLTHEEAATVILGLQDRETRDQAAEWMEGPEAAPALRLWRALSRRCVGPYAEHAAAPLTLAGWVAWSTGDEPEARVALGRALRVDPDYVFARLLHQACNEDLDPETLRSCLREARGSRESPGSRRSGEAPNRPRSQRIRRPEGGAGRRALPPTGVRPPGSASADSGRGGRPQGRRGTRRGTKSER
ncbi:DUF4192 domain-containing protein [Streptomyces sp. NBC_00829]|uniref:DUF4192 domain-containing protein n=1 Tax=Streptomyces sp. NBC_00829 TaxID=2903679 RepID=UPI00386CF954|nr:DUF4192 domain-containing protein [Streptomyces sp. NBC_00829]